MIKDAYYFAHDYEPVNDPKISAMMDDFGAEGYGLFWRITEMLHSESTHKLPLKTMIYKAIAKQMQAKAEQVSKFISCCIEEYELFNSDGNLFWSERVLRNIDKREEISRVRSIAGKRGANAKQLLNNSEPIAQQSQAKKGKEIKENKNAPAAASSEPRGVVSANQSTAN